MYQKKYHIYFVGIGGIGMSGIAELLLNLNYRVSGSDQKLSDITERLKSLGGTIYEGHAVSQVEGVDVVVVSSAISADNPEVLGAKAASIPVIPRAEMLAELMRLKYSIAISGAHGKTSTTSYVGAVLGRGGLDPTIVIGGRLKSLGTNAVLGSGDFIVAEADESDGSFLKYSPAIAVVTNIDKEHLDFYNDIEDIKKVFLSFLDRIPFYGLAILCLDNEHIQDVLPQIRKRFITYGLNTQADLRAKNIRFAGPKSIFEVYLYDAFLGELSLNVPGEHNILNALASIAVGIELNIAFPLIKEALETIDGVQRRLEKKGEERGVSVLDDYGHHPTEIKATLTAIRKSWPEKRLVVVFQPHRYTRTQALFDEFSRAFYQTNVIYVLPIYAASEAPLVGVDSQKLTESIRAHGHKDVLFRENTERLVEELVKELKKGDILLTLGAGNVWQIGEEVIKGLAKK